MRESLEAEAHRIISYLHDEIEDEYKREGRSNYWTDRLSDVLEVMEAMVAPRYIVYFPMGDSYGEPIRPYGPYTKQDAKLVASFLSIDPSEGEYVEVKTLTEAEFQEMRDRVNSEREKVSARLIP